MLRYCLTGLLLFAVCTVCGAKGEDWAKQVLEACKAMGPTLTLVFFAVAGLPVYVLHRYFYLPLSFPLICRFHQWLALKSTFSFLRHNPLAVIETRCNVKGFLRCWEAYGFLKGTVYASNGADGDKRRIDLIHTELGILGTSFLLMLGHATLRYWAWWESPPYLEWLLILLCIPTIIICELPQQAREGWAFDAYVRNNLVSVRASLGSRGLLPDNSDPITRNPSASVTSPESDS